MCIIPRSHPAHGRLCVLHVCRCVIRCTSGQMVSLWMMVHCAMDRVRKIGGSLQLSAGGRFIFPSHTCIPPSLLSPLTHAYLPHYCLPSHPHTCIPPSLLSPLTHAYLPHYCLPSHPHTCILHIMLVRFPRSYAMLHRVGRWMWTCRTNVLSPTPGPSQSWLPSQVKDTS